MGLNKAQRLCMIVVVGLLLSGMLACDFGGGATKPTVTVSSPENLTEVEVGAEVQVVSMVRDTKGVTKVELAVDGVLFSTEGSPSPQGDTSWTLTQIWVATEPGVHNLTVTAYNVDGLASDPWVIAVRVVGGAGPGATGTVTEATSTPAVPGATATAAPSNTPVPPPPPQPDLTISSLTVDPANPALGASAAANFTIRNSGDAQAGQSMLYYQWGPGDTEDGQAQVPALAAGAEHSLNANVGPFHTSFNVSGMIDASSVVTESNEDNNRREFTVNLALPDLTIVELSLDPFPDYGDESDVTITVANIGSGDAGAFDVTYYWAGDGACRFPIDGLGAGAQVTVSCHVGPFWGPFTTYTYADTGADVTESNEDNNRQEIRVSATP